MTFSDLVDYQTAEHITKKYAKNISDLKFKTPNFKSTMNSFCVSISGANLWNDLSSDVKQCSGMKRFRKKYKEF